MIKSYAAMEAGKNLVEYQFEQKPLTVKAIIIKIGIRIIRVWSLSMNIFLIAGSKR